MGSGSEGSSDEGSDVVIERRPRRMYGLNPPCEGERLPRDPYGDDNTDYSYEEEEEEYQSDGSFDDLDSYSVQEPQPQNQPANTTKTSKAQESQAPKSKEPYNTSLKPSADQPTPRTGDNSPKPSASQSTSLTGNKSLKPSVGIFTPRTGNNSPKSSTDQFTPLRVGDNSPARVICNPPSSTDPEKNRHALLWPILQSPSFEPHCKMHQRLCREQHYGRRAKKKTR